MAFSLFKRFRRKKHVPISVDSAQSLSRASFDPLLFDDEFLRQLESLALTFRRARGGSRRGDFRGSRRGSGLEFADYRPYADGDDIRGLDWKIYERLGKLLVRLYEEPEDRRLYLLLDASSSMSHANLAQWDLARQLVAALAYLGLCQLESVSLIALRGESFERLSPTQGKLKIFRILRFLSSLQSQGRTHLGKSIQAFLGTKPAPGVVFLLSDFLDPHSFFAGIDALRFYRFETVVLHFQANDEGLQARGELQLHDCETEEIEVVRLDTQELARSVERQNLQHQALRSYCVRKRVSLFPIQGSPVLKELLFSLRARGVLR